MTLAESTLRTIDAIKLASYPEIEGNGKLITNDTTHAIIVNFPLIGVVHLVMIFLSYFVYPGRVIFRTTRRVFLKMQRTFHLPMLPVFGRNWVDHFIFVS